MDLKRMKDEDKLNLCRKYFFENVHPVLERKSGRKMWMIMTGGFALLPFLWLVNFVWFFREAFIVAAYEQQKQIRTYLIRSGIGVLVWTAIIAAWVAVFQINRADWGATGDQLSFIIPKGIP